MNAADVGAIFEERAAAANRYYLYRMRKKFSQPDWELPKGQVLTGNDLSAAFNGSCAYCGQTINIVRNRYWHVEHITPTRLVGLNVRDNVCIVCFWCNKQKGGLTLNARDKFLWELDGRPPVQGAVQAPPKHMQQRRHLIEDRLAESDGQKMCSQCRKWKSMRMFTRCYKKSSGVLAVCAMQKCSSCRAAAGRISANVKGSPAHERKLERQRIRRKAGAAKARAERTDRRSTRIQANRQLVELGERICAWCDRRLLLTSFGKEGSRRGKRKPGPKYTCYDCEAMDARQRSRVLGVKPRWPEIA